MTHGSTGLHEGEGPCCAHDERARSRGDGGAVVCGLRVDRVCQVVLRLAQRAIEDVPPSLGNKNAHMLLGLGRARVEGQETPRMFILLDVPAVLAHFADTMGIAPAKEGGMR
jgi:chemotaxis signal transduction protein